tara:strand:- start:7 stop:333 length:327 start_codon:yes stop_codon:yes gene_type:complete
MAEQLQSVLAAESERLQAKMDAEKAEQDKMFAQITEDHMCDCETAKDINGDSLRHYVARAAAAGDEQAIAFRKYLIGRKKWHPYPRNNHNLNPEMLYWKHVHEAAIAK